jgi:hypothetical protein
LGGSRKIFYQRASTLVSFTSNEWRAKKQQKTPGEGKKGLGRRIFAAKKRRPKVIENAGVKNIFEKIKISLDNTYWCDTMGLVEKCVPIRSGRFAFRAWSSRFRTRRPLPENKNDWRRKSRSCLHLGTNLAARQPGPNGGSMPGRNSYP